MLVCIFTTLISCKAQQPKYYVNGKRPNTFTFKNNLGDSCTIGVMFNNGDSVLVYTTDLTAFDTTGLPKLSFKGGFSKQGHFLARDQNQHDPWVTPQQFEKFKYAEQKFFTKY